MKISKKRMASLFLALVLTLSLAAPALAATDSREEFTIDFGTHEIVNEEITFREYDFKLEKALGVPKTVKAVHMKVGDSFEFLRKIGHENTLLTLDYMIWTSDDVGFTDAARPQYEQSEPGTLQKITIPDPIPLHEYLSRYGEDIQTAQYILRCWVDTIGESEATCETLEIYYIILDSKQAAPTAPVAPAAVTAKPTVSPVTLNSKPVTLEAYNIEGNNYFMLRDIASILSGTEKQFNVSYDKEKKAVVLTPKTAYAPVGGELAAGSGKAQSAVKSTSPILKDGAEITLTAYNIHGNNFFKLRDLGQAFDFGVDYDKATKSVCIDSAKGYTPEK